MKNLRLVNSFFAFVSLLLFLSSCAEKQGDKTTVTTMDERTAIRTWTSSAILGQQQHPDGKSAMISDAGFSTEIPFSFIYGGKPSAALLSSWKRTIRNEGTTDGNGQHIITWLDPDTGLKIECEVTNYADDSAVEWVLRLTNTGATDTRIIENILPLDMTITPRDKNGMKLHYVNGSNLRATDYVPHECGIAPGSDIILGHDCEGWHDADNNPDHAESIPYFSIEWHGGGMVGAIGWTGFWKFRLRRNEDAELSLQAGQKLTHLKLQPGETIRTPRILLVSWQGTDRMRGHNHLRHLLFDHYAPKQNGQIPVVPIAHIACVDSLGKKDLFLNHAEIEVLNSITEEHQLEVLKKLRTMGVEVFWMDAGWYKGGYDWRIDNDGGGNWKTAKPEAFPRGLRPVSDAAKQRGMKFLLWFSDGVKHATEIENLHPEWVTKFTFHYQDPAARQWITDYFSACIEKHGVDIFRIDGGFLQKPLFSEFWTRHYKGNYSPPDADPDRQGITENHYVEGFYAMLDELLRRHPGLMIDNANWRGRGCDIELGRRTIGSLTRCEYTSWGDQQACEQMGTATLSQYTPLSGSIVTSFDPYAIRSAATTGVAFSLPTPLDQDFPVEEARLAFEEIRSLRPYWSGDFYPLIERIDADESNWCAWQFHRPDLDAGFAVFFRRSKSPLSGNEVALRGLDPAAKYEVTFKETYEVKEKRTMTGAKLRTLRVEIGNAPGSVLVIYMKKGISGNHVTLPQTPEILKE